MIEKLKKIFGISPAPDFVQLMKLGAVIVDVRSRQEYAGGHIEGSLNIPVDQLRQNLQRLPGKDKTIVTCCASGMRSASAREFLKSQGYQHVYNGGGWASLKRKL